MSRKQHADRMPNPFWLLVAVCVLFVALIATVAAALSSRGYNLMYGYENTSAFDGAAIWHFHHPDDGLIFIICQLNTGRPVASSTFQFPLRYKRFSFPKFTIDLPSRKLSVSYDARNRVVIIDTERYQLENGNVLILQEDGAFKQHTASINQELFRLNQSSYAFNAVRRAVETDAVE